MDSVEPMPVSRPRVSLLSLLLLTGMIASWLTTASLWSEIAPLRRELRQLRDESGTLSITDNRKPHAIELETEDPNHWKWRVWVPEGRRYEVCCVHGGVPLKGLPARNTLVWLDPGTHVIDYRLTREETRDAWSATVEAANAIDATRVAWGEPAWYIVRGVGRSTTAFDADEPAVLCRYRASNDANPRTINGPTDGFMIWLEPVP